VDSTIIIALIGAILGGTGVAVINAIANRKKLTAEVTAIGKKAAADCVATLSQAYETRITALHTTIARMENKLEVVEAQIIVLRSTLSEREVAVTNLQTENDDLYAQVVNLRVAVKHRDARITDLIHQVAELTLRLDEYCGPKADG
jgi:chromosome segregation ATPase